jgi:hypothetical protein
MTLNFYFAKGAVHFVYEPIGKYYSCKYHEKCSFISFCFWKGKTGCSNNAVKITKPMDQKDFQKSSNCVTPPFNYCIYTSSVSGTINETVCAEMIVQI